MIKRNWTTSELVIAFYQYCVTPYGRIHSGNRDIIALADKLGRTPGALAMKMCNFANFDPIQQARGVKGLSNASRADKIVLEYHRDEVFGKRVG